MNKAEPWITEVHNECAVIDGAARHLMHLAVCCRSLGLSKLADDLGSVADDMRQSEKAIRKACSRELNDSLRNAEEGTAGLLKLALHGALTPKRSMLTGDEVIALVNEGG